MDAKSLTQYLNCKVRIVLKNNFWYIGKVVNVENGDFTFIDIKGKQLSIDPEFIVFIEEVK